MKMQIEVGLPKRNGRARLVKEFEGYQYFGVYDGKGDFLFGFHINSLLGKVYFTCTNAVVKEKQDIAVRLR